MKKKYMVFEQVKSDNITKHLFSVLNTPHADYTSEVVKETDTLDEAEEFMRKDARKLFVLSIYVLN